MEQQPRLPLWFLVANWVLVVAAFVAGVLVGKRHIADLPDPQATALELVYNKVLQEHVEPQDGHRLLDAAIEGMLDGLDEYSHYVPPDEVARYDETSTGRYAGVGMVMHPDARGAVVCYPFPGGGAERAGLRPGDLIVAVDGTTIVGTSLDKVAEMVRGEPDTEVRLTVQRDEAPRDVVVRRGDVQKRSVKWAQWLDAEHGLGYLYVSDFHGGAAGQMQQAIASLQAQRPLRGLIVDLRFNPGGSLDECVAMARLFVASGTIVSQRRRGELLEKYEASPDQCKWPDLPLVLLLNGDSASASEVFAGCLQDHQRATIVGERSYGKGCVNTIYSYRDFRLKLTTGYYYTPNGRNVNRTHRRDPHAGSPTNGAAAKPPDDGGIAPDVAVPLPRDREVAVAQLLVQRQEPPEAWREAFLAAAAKWQIPVPQPLQPADDAQLAQALATLTMAATGK